MSKNIHDFFIIKLDSIPDSNFIEGNSEINSSGDTIKNFRKSLSYLECNIFDTIEIKQFEGGTKNIFFKNHELDNVDMTEVQKIVDELYLVYGQDDNHKGKFNSKDKEDYLSNDFYSLFGRAWAQENKIKTPIDLSIDRDLGTITLGIWGIGMD
jgi:5-methylcytosine-specific restriction endonuclease McrBC regulatory subunit McrC